MIAVWGRTNRVHLISFRMYELLRGRGIRPKVMGLYGPNAINYRPRTMQVIL